MKKIRWVLGALFLCMAGTAIASSIIPVYSGSWDTQSGGFIVDPARTPGTCPYWTSPPAGYSGAQLTQTSCSTAATYPVIDFAQTNAESSCSSTCTLGVLSVTTGTSDGPNGNWYVTVTENIPASLSASATEYGFEGCIEMDPIGSDGVGLVTQSNNYGTCSATAGYTIVSAAVVSGEVSAEFNTFTITYTAYYANSTTIDVKCLGATNGSDNGSMGEGLCGITAVPE